MLPGFRFLFATVVLAVSVLVFGLGAAALLRAAHEEFASLPSWRLAQPPPLAPQPELRAPTLAMLRIEAPVQKSMMETIRPRPDVTRPDTIHLNVLRDVPDTRPVEVAPPNDVAAPKDDDATVQIEQSPPASAPATEAVASLNAQASIDAPAAAGAPIEEPSIESRPAETNATETNGIEPIQPVAKPLESKQTAATSSETEASEPTAIEAIASTARSSEATAADTLPNPIVKKATRPNARTIARRRQAIARARAAARERSRLLLQQQGHNPDPLTQIFGGSGGGNVPRPASG